jgi:hypothetical protein
LGYRFGKSTNGKVLADLRNRLSSCQSDSAIYERKATEYFNTIESVLKERDTWRTWYYESAAGHGTAQSLLMTERERLIHQLQAHGIKPHTHPQVDEVVALCSEQHQMRVLPPPATKPETG